MAFTLDRLSIHFPQHDKEQLQKIIDLLRHNVDPLDLPGVKAWVDACYHMPDRRELLMSAFNEVLEYHGVEDCHLESESDNYRTGTVSTYCNSGDTYGPTIIYDASRGKFILSDMGSFVEAHASEE